MAKDFVRFALRQRYMITDHFAIAAHVRFTAPLRVVGGGGRNAIESTHARAWMSAAELRREKSPEEAHIT
jgi:hypothetical protein